MNTLPPGYAGHVELVRTADLEGDDNRGYRADLIEATVDGEPAGYAMTLFVPRDRFEAWYPNGVWDYLRMHGGKTGLPVSPDDARAAEALESYRMHSGAARGVAGQGSRIMKWLETRFAEGWEGFQAFSVERPKMDYIRVYSDDDSTFKRFSGGGREFVPRERVTDFQGLGLGQLLYREMARWHAEEGRRLHSSSLIEPEAVASWSRMADALPGAVVPEEREAIRAQARGPLFVLDGARIGPWAPEWAASARLVRGGGSIEDLCAAPAPVPGR